MHAQRLDLGAEVVVIPSRDLVVIHPDLAYAEALGAVMGTLPDLHPDSAKALVDQVTPQPREPRRPGLLSRVASALTAAALAMPLAGIALPADASPDFGPYWRQQMASLGLTCADASQGGSVRECLDSDNETHRVKGIARSDGDLYLVSTDSGCHNIKVFHREADALAFGEEHPNVTLAGRVASW